jgi:hypothetical protein
MRKKRLNTCNLIAGNEGHRKRWSGWWARATCWYPALTRTSEALEPVGIDGERSRSASRAECNSRIKIGGALEIVGMTCIRSFSGLMRTPAPLDDEHESAAFRPPDLATAPQAGLGSNGPVSSSSISPRSGSVTVVDHHRARSLQDRPRGLIPLDSELSLQQQRDIPFVCRHQIRQEPRGQRRLAL